MLEFIAIGGILFWILTAAALFTMIAGVAQEKGVLATCAFTAYLIIIAAFSPFNLIGTILANPLWLLAMIGVYFVCGILWVFPRWETFCRSRRRKYNELRDTWLAEKGYPNQNTVPDNLKSQWTDYVSNHVDVICGKHCPRSVSATLDSATKIQTILTPRVRTHKSTILFWMSYWPLDMFWAFTNDFIIGTWNYIYSAIGSILQSRANKAFASVADDLKAKADG